MNALKEIREREANYKGANVTRYYNQVIPTHNGECRIDTYAVKTRNKRTGELAIKKVARYYTDRRRFYVRDIIFHNFTHSYLTNWCNEPFGRKHQAVWEDVDAHIGIWGYCERDNLINLGGDYLNWFDGTRYEHCGYDVNSGMHFLDYAECYNINRGVEFLGKSELWKLITPSFVRKLSTDKGLFNFFRSHLDEIRQHSCRGGFYCEYSISEIEHAYRRRISLADARLAIRARYAFRDYGNHCVLPPSIDKLALLKWCNKNDVTEMEYCRYAKYVQECGEDITAFGVTMPRNFKATLEAYEERAHRAEAKRLAKERKAYNAGIKSVAEAFAMLSRLKRHGLGVVLPMNVKQLIDEGNAMHNCIGGMGYDERIVNGKSLIVFLYKDGKPFVDIEIDREHWTVRQCYTKCNQNPEEKINAFAKFICDKAKAIYRKAA